MGDLRVQPETTIGIDLPEGYRETELGPLPEEWRVVRLKECIEQSRQKNKKAETLPVYSISNQLGFVLSDEFFGKQVYSRNLSTYKVIDYGHFAYNPYRINVGSLGLFRENTRGLVSPAYVVFRLANQSKLIEDYLYLVLKSDRYISEIKRLAMSRGSVRRSLSFKDLGEIQVPLPHFPNRRP